MKKMSFSLLLVAVAFTAYADKNRKANDTTTQRKEQPQAVTEQQQPLDFGGRMYDSRMARHGYVAPDSADIVKYGISRPTMPAQSKPYQFSDGKPVKQ